MARYGYTAPASILGAMTVVRGRPHTREPRRVRERQTRGALRQRTARTCLDLSLLRIGFADRQPGTSAAKALRSRVGAESNPRPGDREVFKAARAGNLWTEPSMCPGGCALESLWSWTTGVPQVVLAKPFSGTGPFAVATIAIPMLSLIDPVIPSGYLFVISTQGPCAFSLRFAAQPE